MDFTTARKGSVKRFEKFQNVLDQGGLNLRLSKVSRVPEFTMRHETCLAYPLST